MLNGFRTPTRLAVASLIVAVCLGAFSVACGPAEAGENPIVVMETSMGFDLESKARAWAS